MKQQVNKKALTLAKLGEAAIGKHDQEAHALREAALSAAQGNAKQTIQIYQKFAIAYVKARDPMKALENFTEAEMYLPSDPFHRTKDPEYNFYFGAAFAEAAKLDWAVKRMDNYETKIYAALEKLQAAIFECGDLDHFEQYAKARKELLVIKQMLSDAPEDSNRMDVANSAFLAFERLLNPEDKAFNINPLESAPKDAKEDLKGKHAD